MNLDLIPIDDFEKFQHKMRMRRLPDFKPVASGRYLLSTDPSRWADEKPFSPIKPNDLPLDKFLALRAAKKVK